MCAGGGLITGRVHGVRSRASAEREAARLRVTGFVPATSATGSVTVEAEGSPVGLSFRAMEAWCRIVAAFVPRWIAVEG